MKIRKIITLGIVLCILFTSFLSIAQAHGAKSWYIRRCGNEIPKIDKDQEIIYKHNGIYMDNNAKGDKKIIYLTFDAGYENGNIEKILDVLKEKDVKAAFFILDYVIKKTPELVKRMDEEGHTVCNHTKNHKDMTTLTDEEMRNNLTALEESYEKLIGKSMEKFFRFPEGKYDERTLAVANEMGYKTVFWSFAYADWDNDKQPDEKKALDLILNNTHNGEIILLHPNSATNASILPKLIDEWRNMGYEFGTLDMI